MINAIILSILPWVTEFKENIFYIWMNSWSAVFGGPEIVFTIMFGITGLGIYIGSEKNLSLLFGYLILIDIFFSVLFLHPVVLIFMLITIIIGAVKFNEIYGQRG